MQHRFDATILRQYDIRGVVGETLNNSDAYAIGLGFAAIMAEHNAKRIAIGYDGRISSPELAAALTDGLTAGGAEVIPLGMTPTPALYFADIHLDTDAAIEVTGSHNPPDHNGFKMVLGHKPFFGGDIQRLGAMVADGIDAPGGGKISPPDCDITAAWIAAILAAADAPQSLAPLDGKTIIWDCGNGAMGPAVLALLPQLPGNHIPLFAQVDGTFPNHHPDPTDPTTLGLLREAMNENSAHLGIGFDGDGDRIGLLDAKARPVMGDCLTAYLAGDILTHHPDAEIIFDIKSSLAALEKTASLGGRPGLWKTGHSHMKLRMAERDAPLGGEMSGHIFIRHRYHGFDDALFAALMTLRRWCATNESMDAFMDSLAPTYATSEMRIPCADTKKFAVMESVIADMEANPDPDITEIITIDGIRVVMADGWWLLRASNTGGYLVARAEARSEARRDAFARRITARLRKAGINWQK